MYLLDDHPTDQDLFGFGHTADQITRAIADAASAPLRVDTASLPHTIGVLGGWGSGKTSLMAMVQQRLQARGFKTVWFNAWKYDGKEVIWNALLKTVFMTMRADARQEDESARTLRMRVSQTTAALGQTAAALTRLSAKVGTRLVPGGILKEEDVDAVMAALRPQLAKEAFDRIDAFDIDFATLVDQYVGDAGYLVIFIDDLDRCLPDNAIQVLEALKLYHKASCSFVVGCDPEVIAEAINRRYSSHPALSSVEYLEKFVQMPFAVPRLSVRDALVVLAKDVFTPAESQPMERLVRNATKRNPRRVKRFVNAFSIAIADADPLQPDDRLKLAKVLLTRICFPQFYDELCIDPGLFKSVDESDAEAWSRGELAELAGDKALRRFLANTRDVCPDQDDVRRWIRADTSRPLAEEEAEDDLDAAEGMRG